MKWAELAGHSSKAHCATLSEHVKAAGFANEVTFIEGPADQLSHLLPDILKNHSVVRVESPFAEIILSHFKSQPALIRSIGAADTLVKVGDNWDLRSATYWGLEKALGELKQGLDRDSSALIVGAGAAARVAAAVIIKLGFRNVRFTNRQAERAQKIIDYFKKIYFDVELEYIPPEKLVLLTGTHGVLINTTPFTPDNALLNELYYFNFLKAPGLVVDLATAAETPLMKEAREIGVPVLGGARVAAWSDVYFANWCFGVELKYEEYFKSLSESLAKPIC
jgi:shikimate dehydrogenase